MASAAGSPVIASLRTIKSDVVVGLGLDGDETAERLDKTEPGWRISGKYVSLFHLCEALSNGLSLMFRLLFLFRRVTQAKKFVPLGTHVPHYTDIKILEWV